jgi:long-chain fatty acid transport protein
MLRKRKAILMALTSLLALTAVQRSVFSGGFMIPHQTARGLGLSNAMTAGVNDASAVYYNPAALSEAEGNNLLASGIYVNILESIQNSGRRAVNKDAHNFLGSFFANYHVPATDFTIGIGMYAPFGLSTSYDRQGFTRFAAQRTELRTIFLTPAIAWHPSDYFSVGGGLSYVHASGLFSRALCLDPVTGCTLPIGLEGSVRIKDRTDAFGYNVGALVKPREDVKLGFSYRSRVDLRFDSANVRFEGAFSTPETKATLRPVSLPAVINAGVFWQITPRWGTEFVYESTRWSAFRTLTARFSPTPVFLPLAAPIPGFSLPHNWKDTSTLRLGAFYALDNWEFRGGLALEETPIPSRTLNPAIPDADKLTLNAGIGYKWEQVSIDLGYMAVFYKTRRVINNELEGLPATAPLFFAGAPGRDKYETFVNFVTLSLGYRF